MKKLGLSQIVGMTLLIAITLVAISIVFVMVKDQINFSPDIQCSSLGIKSHIFLRSACYLNDGEISVSLERDLDSFEIQLMDFTFSEPFEMEFVLTGGKCLDIRDSSSEYGRDCFLIEAGQKKNYVFNVSGEERIKKFSLGLGLDNFENCAINQIEIKDNC